MSALDLVQRLGLFAVGAQRLGHPFLATFLLSQRRAMLTVTQKTIEFGGLTREYWIHYPTVAPPPSFEGVPPLIIEFHGHGGNGRRQAGVHGAPGPGADYATLVFPSALVGSDGVTAWATEILRDPGVTDPYWDQDQRFAGFLRDAYLDLHPAAKTFAAGFSNGGTLVHQLAVHDGASWDAFGLCSKSVPTFYADWSVDVPRPVISLIGDSDDKAQWTGDEGTLSAELSRDWWAQQLGQGLADWTETEDPTEARTNSIVRTYTSPGATPFRWIRVQRGEHHWFRPDAGDDFRASAAMFRFFADSTAAL